MVVCANPRWDERTARELIGLVLERTPRLRVLATLKALPSDMPLDCPLATTAGNGTPERSQQRTLALVRITAVASTEHFFGQPIFIYEVCHDCTAPRACIEENRYRLSQGDWCW